MSVISNIGWKILSSLLSETLCNPKDVSSQRFQYLILEPTDNLKNSNKICLAIRS